MPSERETNGFHELAVVFRDSQAKMPQHVVELKQRWLPSLNGLDEADTYPLILSLTCLMSAAESVGVFEVLSSCSCSRATLYGDTALAIQGFPNQDTRTYVRDGSSYAGLAMCVELWPVGHSGARGVATSTCKLKTLLMTALGRDEELPCDPPWWSPAQRRRDRSDAVPSCSTAADGPADDPSGPAAKKQRTESEAEYQRLLTIEERAQDAEQRARDAEERAQRAEQRLRDLETQLRGVEAPQRGAAPEGPGSAPEGVAQQPAQQAQTQPPPTASQAATEIPEMLREQLRLMERRVTKVEERTSEFRWVTSTLGDRLRAAGDMLHAPTPYDPSIDPVDFVNAMLMGFDGASQQRWARLSDALYLVDDGITLFVPIGEALVHRMPDLLSTLAYAFEASGRPRHVKIGDYDVDQLMDLVRGSSFFEDCIGNLLRNHLSETAFCALINRVRLEVICIIGDGAGSLVSSSFFLSLEQQPDMPSNVSVPEHLDASYDAFSSALRSYLVRKAIQMRLLRAVVASTNKALLSATKRAPAAGVGALPPPCTNACQVSPQAEAPALACRVCGCQRGDTMCNEAVTEIQPFYYFDFRAPEERKSGVDIDGKCVHGRVHKDFGGDRDVLYSLMCNVCAYKARFEQCVSPCCKQDVIPEQESAL